PTLATQLRQQPRDRLPSGLTDDIADGENAHRGTLAASRIRHPRGHGKRQERTSFLARSCDTRRALLGVVDGSRLPNDRYLDLPRVLQRLLDLRRDVTRETRGREIVDLLRPHDDADLASGLDGKRLFHAVERIRDLFQLL